MFVMIGFGFCVFPLIIAGTYGFKRLWDTKGKLSTFLMALSLPFYWFTMKSLAIDLTNFIKYGANGFPLSTFTLKAFSGFLILIVLSHVFYIIHKRKEKKSL